MKNIFDEVQFADLKLNSRIVRTGTWETETAEGGFLTPDVYDRYEKIASSGTGLIVSEIFALDPKDRFFPYSTNMNYRGFIKDYQMVSDIVHKRVFFHKLSNHSTFKTDEKRLKSLFCR